MWVPPRHGGVYWKSFQRLYDRLTWRVSGYKRHIHFSPIPNIQFHMPLCYPLVVFSGIVPVSLPQSHPRTQPPLHISHIDEQTQSLAPLWCLYPGLSGVIHSVVNTLGAPEWIRVVKLEQVDSTARILMAASVYLLVTVPPVHWHNLIHLGLPCILLGLLLFIWRFTYRDKVLRWAGGTSTILLRNLPPLSKIENITKPFSRLKNQRLNNLFNRMFFLQNCWCTTAYVRITWQPESWYF